MEKRNAEKSENSTDSTEFVQTNGKFLSLGKSASPKVPPEFRWLALLFAIW